MGRAEYPYTPLYSFLAYKENGNEPRACVRAYYGTYVRVKHILESTFADQCLSIFAGLLRGVGFRYYQGLISRVNHEFLYIFYKLLEALLVSAHLLPDFEVALIVQVHDGYDIQSGAKGRRGLAHSSPRGIDKSGHS